MFCKFSPTIGFINFSSHFSKAVIVLLVAMVSIASCTKPFSKESYLEKYEAFIEKVGEEYGEYDEDDWEKADAKYQKFNEEWYEEFEEDLTLKEELEITKWSLQYKYFKTNHTLGGMFNEYLKDDYEKLKEQLKYYRENHMEEDIDRLMKEAIKAGDTTAVIVKQALEEVEKEIEEEAKKQK